MKLSESVDPYVRRSGQTDSFMRGRMYSVRVLGALWECATVQRNLRAGACVLEFLGPIE